jgi:hypothetical protein
VQSSVELVLLIGSVIDSAFFPREEQQSWVPFFLNPLYQILSETCILSSAKKKFTFITKHCTTLSNGYLGSRNDEERSEMRYVMRIAEFSESSNL